MVEVEKDKDTEVVKLWFIDLDWYKQNNRSFSISAQSCLCPKCAEQLIREGKKISAAALISRVKGCCSHDPAFITDRRPILESIFRFFLANGNQPLALEEVGKQLSERRGGNTYCTAAKILSCILENDCYYGLRPANG